MNERILITLSNGNDPKIGEVLGDNTILYSDKATAMLLQRHGAIPIYMPSLPKVDEKVIDEMLSLADGVLLTGQHANVNPLYYGEDPVALFGRIDDERDRTEILLVQKAYERGLPIFAICKGAGTVNVALGGTIYQDIAKQLDINHEVRKTNRSNLTRRVVVEQDSLLYDIFQKDEIDVNCSHSEAAKELATGLRATARSRDGIVEVYESSDPKKFVMALQFHPELRDFDPYYAAIFDKFLETCRRTKRR